MSDLFGTAGPHSAPKPLTVFRAKLTGSEETSWEELFAGYTALKAITYYEAVSLEVPNQHLPHPRNRRAA